MKFSDWQARNETLSGSFGFKFISLCSRFADRFLGSSLSHSLRDGLLYRDFSPALLHNPAVVLRDASIYKVDTDAIALKVKQEFAAKEKVKKLGKSTPPAAAKIKKVA